MDEIYEHRISDHAADRYRERIRDVPRERAKAEILECLKGASAKDLRKMARLNKNTVMIRTGCCTMICSHGNIVTIVSELRCTNKKAAEPEGPDGQGARQGERRESHQNYIVIEI